MVWDAEMGGGRMCWWGDGEGGLLLLGEGWMPWFGLL